MLPHSGHPPRSKRLPGISPQYRIFNPPMESLVTIKTYTYAHEAAIAKSLLASQNIFCFLKDELTIQANPLYSNALGGVKLQVRQSDAATASKILQAANHIHVHEDKTISIRTPSGEIDECPACESDEISLTRRPSGKIFGISLLLLGFPLPLFSAVYHCYNCGRDIKVIKQRAGGDAG